MIEYVFPILMPLAGRMHGVGNRKYFRFISLCIVGACYGYAVYDVTGDLLKCTLAASCAAGVFAMSHTKAIYNPWRFVFKGIGIAIVAAFFMQSIAVLLSSALGWMLTYMLAKKYVGYDACQEWKFFAPKIWTFWGEVGSLFFAALGLVWGMR